MVRRSIPPALAMAWCLTVGGAGLAGCLARLEVDGLEQGALANADAEAGAEPNDGGAADGEARDAEAPGRTLVIRQIYGGGGLPGARLDRDFVELFNASSAPQTLEGLSLQIAGPSAPFAAPVVRLPALVVAPGRSLTVAFGAEPDASGEAFVADLAQARTPVPDVAGKVALVRGNVALGCGADAGPCGAERIVDLVGYGEGVSVHEGNGAAPSLSSALAAHRRDEGCADTDDNREDFTADVPEPRNLESEARPCEPIDGGAEELDASLDAREAGPREAGPRDAGPREARPRDAAAREAAPRDDDADEADRPSSAPAGELEAELAPEASSAGCALAPDSTPRSTAGGLATVALALACATRRASRRRHLDPEPEDSTSP